MSVGRLPRWIPASVRRGLGAAAAVHTSIQIRLATRRMLGGSRTVILGPWLGEVGFELLYWIPFLRWALRSSGASPDRLVAVSRGGADAWYAGIARTYCDAFDYMGVDEFRQGNEQRQAVIGEQKQTRPTAADERIIAAVRRTINDPTAEVLHPSMMYRMMRPYWWKHVPATWVGRHASFARLRSVPANLPTGIESGEYVAVKFYFNECFPPTPANRDYASAVTRKLADRWPVVSLSIALGLDDHEAPAFLDPDRRVARPLTAAVDPRRNLALQHTIVANAKAFVGTYGGFSYLAPFCGVPATGVFQRADGFDRAHLDAAQDAYRTIGTGPLAALCTHDTTPDELAAAVGLV